MILHKQKLYFLISSIPIITSLFSHGVDGFVSVSSLVVQSTHKTTLSSLLLLRETKQGHEQQQQVKPCKHLFRHYNDIALDSWIRCVDPEDFLMNCGFQQEEIPNKLLSMSTHDQLAPTMRFLVNVMKGGTGKIQWVEDVSDDGTGTEPFNEQAAVNTLLAGQIEDNNNNDNDDLCEIHNNNDNDDFPIHCPKIFDWAKEQYFDLLQLRLDKLVAPFHAYLKWSGLPHGQALLKDERRWNEFVKVCKARKNAIVAFSHLCMKWTREQSHPMSASTLALSETQKITSFVELFQGGLKEAIHKDNTDASKYMVPLLLEHGANDSEDADHDNCIGLAHMAAKHGCLSALKQLLQAKQKVYNNFPLEEVILLNVDIQGDTILHYAQSPETIRWILLQFSNSNTRQFFMDQRGSNGDTALMKAVRHANYNILTLLLSLGANAQITDMNGDSIVHAAISNDPNKSLELCQFLSQYGTLIDLFVQPNNQNKTPLQKAIEHDNRDLAKWLAGTFYSHYVRQEELSEILSVCRDDAFKEELLQIILQNKQSKTVDP